MLSEFYRKYRSRGLLNVFESRIWLAVAVNAGRFYCRPSLWKQTQERPLKSTLIRFGTDGTPLPSGIDSERSMPKMKSIAVEAFGRHLKGADASVPFSFGGFSEIPENPRMGFGLYRFYTP